MLSDWQRRKLEHRFDVQDRNHDGCIDLGDYMRIVDTMAELNQWPPESAQYDSLRTTYLSYWHALCKMMDKDGDERVTLQEFVAGFEGLLEDPENYRRYVEAVATNLFEGVDTDADGKIDLGEFSVPQQAYGLTAEQARQTFQRLDVNGQGFLTRDDIHARAHEFFNSDDPAAPGSWLFGVFEP
jgi:Ca2+-binding EF-hand superfamily protein